MGKLHELGTPPSGSVTKLKEFMEDKQPQFAFGKKLGLAEFLYGNIPAIASAIEHLMVCMKETNKTHQVECEFFRIDFRPRYLDEQIQFPYGSLILDMKWGSKKELNEKKVAEE